VAYRLQLIIQGKAVKVKKMERFSKMQPQAARSCRHRIIAYCEVHQWAHAMSRLGTHPHEAKEVSTSGKTPLHIACSNHGMSVLIVGLSSLCPHFMEMSDPMGMTPLHCACACNDPSEEILEIMLRWSPSKGLREGLMQDLDGDTPLHAACRVGASVKVLSQLVTVAPSALHIRDNEHLTPLLRLWVRAVVLVGEDVIQSVRSWDDLRRSGLEPVWEKTLLFLKVLTFGVVRVPAEGKFSVLHAIVENDCPRFVLDMALALYPEWVTFRDDLGRSVLTAAIEAPVHKVRDLSSDNFAFFDAWEDSQATLENDDDDPNMIVKSNGTVVMVPSVIDTLLTIATRTNESTAKALLASVRGDGGRLLSPLQCAVAAGKGWSDGVKTFFDADPDAASKQDNMTRLFPFMVAAANCKTKATHVDTIFHLLICNPSVVDNGQQPIESLPVTYICEDSSRKRKMQLIGKLIDGDGYEGEERTIMVA
jgi:hypothetical protein